MDKQIIQQKQEQLLALIKQLCDAKIDDEYYEIAERLVKKLGRKRDVPFISGQLEIWAVAVIHAIGTVNFLFDRSNKPYASIDDINDFFGTKKSTTSTKSKQIRDMLKMRTWDKEFSIKSMQESNPFNSLVMINGMLLPISTLPEHLQEAVKKARAEGKDLSFRYE